jgi:hypothetical protein
VNYSYLSSPSSLIQRLLATHSMRESHVKQSTIPTWQTHTHTHNKNSPMRALRHVNHIKSQTPQ